MLQPRPPSRLHSPRRTLLSADLRQLLTSLLTPRGTQRSLKRRRVANAQRARQKANLLDAAAKMARRKKVLAPRAGRRREALAAVRVERRRKVLLAAKARPKKRNNKTQIAAQRICTSGHMWGANPCQRLDLEGRSLTRTAFFVPASCCSRLSQAGIFASAKSAT